MGQTDSEDTREKLSNPFIEIHSFFFSPSCFYDPDRGDVQVNTSSSCAVLFDATVAHGLCFTDSFASDLKGSTLVRCDTLTVCEQVWLNLFPDLLFRVQLFVRFTCN